ncbi:LysR family transcriptional regulator [Tsukamurella soli]
MDERQLRAFTTIAQTRSFTRAATQLGYSQSAVTSQIKSLEQQMRCPLFERRRDGTYMTAAGQRLLPTAQRILRLTEEALSAGRDDHDLEGTLNIGATESIATYRLPAVIQEFRCRYPNLRLSIKTFHEGAVAMLAALSGYTIDAAFLHTDAALPAPYDSVGLGDEPLSLVAHPSITTTEDQPLLTVGEHCIYASTYHSTGSRDRHTTVMGLGTIEAVKQAAIAGIGVAPLPTVAVARELGAGALHEIAWANPAPLTARAAWLGEHATNPPIRALADILRNKPIPAHAAAA